jgi:hypothetical protein
MTTFCVFACEIMTNLYFVKGGYCYDEVILTMCLLYGEDSIDIDEKYVK